MSARELPDLLTQPESAGEAGTPALPVAGASAIRKAGLRILPLLGVGYAIAFMDRMNISFAALQMNRDLGFTASTYGFGAGLFFLSYAAWEIPSNLLLLRFGARRWMARIMVTWGLLAAAMMFVRTAHEFYAMRFLLGFAEAGFFPGIVYYLTLWFPSTFRARAVGYFYIALPLSSTIMGLLAGSLLGLSGRIGLAGWQWLFLIEGLPAILLGLVFLRFLPDGPATARWLSEQERSWLVDRLASEGPGPSYPHGKHPTGAELRGIFLSLRVWIPGLIFLFTLGCMYAYNFSAPIIIQRLTGASVSRVGFIVAAIGVLGAAAMLFNSLHSDRTGERYLHILLPCLLMAAAYAVAGRTTNPWIGVPALALAASSYYAMQGPLWSTSAWCFRGPAAAAGIAAINTIGIVGGFLGPWGMGAARDLTGDYQRGLQTLSLPILTAAVLVVILHRQMARREIRS